MEEIGLVTPSPGQDNMMPQLTFKVSNVNTSVCRLVYKNGNQIAILL